MLRQASILGLASVLLFTNAEIGIAAKKPATCKTLGATKISGGERFTCMKQGKTLIWRVKSSAKSQAKPAATPSPTPSLNVFQTPFPDEFTRTEMVTAVKSAFKAYTAANSKKMTYKLVIDSDFEKVRPLIESFVDRTYSVLPFPKDYQKTIVVITRNRDFGEKEISSFGFDRSDSNKAAGGPCMNCAGEGWAVMEEGLYEVVPHEIFHIWQKAAYKRKGNNNPDPNNPLNPPVWFDEGSADFFGVQMYREASNINMHVGKVGPIQSLQRYSTRDLSPSLPYTLGRLASEYIVASVGVDKFLQIFFEVGEGLDFPSAFEKSVGISLQSFYEKFDRNVGKMI